MPAVARPGASFRSQLLALMLARRRFSAAQRRESPGAWWTKRVLLSVGAAWVLFGSAASAIAIARDTEVDPARAAVLFLLGPIAVASLLMVTRLRAEADGHPLGEPRWLLPLSRWRSAWLATAEDVVSLETAFIAALGVLPWLGTLAAGENWLTPWGWCAVALAPMAAVAYRTLLISVQAWAANASDGGGGVVLRAASILALVLVPFATGAIAELFSAGSADVLRLPLLDAVNHPAAPFGIFAGVAAVAGLGVFIRSRRAPGWLRKLPRLAAPRWTTRGASFAGNRVVAAMLRMMVVQALRQPTYRFATLMVAVFSFITLFFHDGPGPGLLIFHAFVPAIMGMYNLYGSDAGHYTLWLGTGRRLAEWTVARQLFFAAYMAVFSTLAITVLTISGVLDAELSSALVAGGLTALGLGWLAGPAVSRYVLSPQASELGRRRRVGASGRSWVSLAAAAATAAAAIVASAPALLLGWWWAAWPFPLLLGFAILVTRNGEAEWTAELRGRMAQAFRAASISM